MSGAGGGDVCGGGGVVICVFYYHYLPLLQPPSTDCPNTLLPCTAACDSACALPFLLTAPAAHSVRDDLS